MRSGIVLCGHSGSGKTSVAHALQGIQSTNHLVEASRDIVSPVLELGGLPSTSNELTTSVQRSRSTRSRVGLRDPHTEVFREDVRSLIFEANRRYGPDWIAKLVALGCEELASERVPIVAGIRGIDNVRRLCEVGFFVVFLDAPAAVLAERQAARDRVSIEKAIREQLLEERAYATNRIADLAALVVDVRDISIVAVATRIYGAYHSRV